MVLLDRSCAVCGQSVRWTNRRRGRRLIDRSELPGLSRWVAGLSRLGGRVEEFGPSIGCLEIEPELELVVDGLSNFIKPRMAVSELVDSAPRVGELLRSLPLLQGCFKPCNFLMQCADLLRRRGLLVALLDLLQLFRRLAQHMIGNIAHADRLAVRRCQAAGC